MKTSVTGAINMLGMAKRCHAKVLQASTSEVYGDPEVHPQPESYRGSVNPIGVRACYDEGKRAAETLFMDYHRMHHTNIRIVRIFNTYGPRMHPFDGRVVSNFIRQALSGQPLPFSVTVAQTRSFCYRDDLVEGIIRMMNAARRIHRTGQSGEPRRVHDSGTGRIDRGTHRIQIGDHPTSASSRRSDAAASGYYTGPKGAWTGSPRSACGTGCSRRSIGFVRRTCPSTVPRRQTTRVSLACPSLPLPQERIPVEVFGETADVNRAVAHEIAQLIRERAAAGKTLRPGARHGLHTHRHLRRTRPATSRRRSQLPERHHVQPG